MNLLLTHINSPAANFVLANLRWNPTFRGILFPLILFTVLCGSSYLIMSTNVGNRLGFLLAWTAFWGWMAMMAVAWMIYGIGKRGADPRWVVKEYVSVTADATFEKVHQLPSDPLLKKAIPKAWKIVKEGEPTRAEAESAVAAFIGEQHLDPTVVTVAGYQYGGSQVWKVWPKLEHDTIVNVKSKEETVKSKSWYNPGNYYFKGLRHTPHYYVAQFRGYKTVPVRVAGVIQYDDNGIAKTNVVKVDGKAVADLTKPVKTFILLRDLGSRRQPPFITFLFSLAILLMSLFSLHRRDKHVMAEMAKAKAA